MNHGRLSPGVSIGIAQTVSGIVKSENRTFGHADADAAPEETSLPSAVCWKNRGPSSSRSTAAGLECG